MDAQVLQSDEERKLQERSTGRRFAQLDALRGIAAVTVVAYHTRRMLHETPVRRTMLPLFAGSQAVMLFFVLSGFVLSLSFWRGKAPRYSLFVLTRIIRIYLPFAAASALSILGDLLFYRFSPPLSDWAAATWHAKPTLASITSQLLMIPSPVFNTALWSLTYEMELSFVLPPLIWLMAKTRASGVLVATAALACLPLPVHWGTWNTNGLRTALWVTVLFVVGATLADQEHRVRVLFRRVGKGSWLVFALSLILFYDLPLRAHSLAVGWSFWAMSGFGAAGIIVCALTLPALATWLRHPVLEYLGRISYSLYLTHSIVLFATFDLAYGHLPIPVIYAIVALGSWALAHIFCVLIEEPCTRLQKSLKTRQPARV